MKNPKVSIWGIGQHVRKNILSVLKDVDCLELTGFWTRDSSTRENLQTKSFQSYSSKKQMLEDSKLDVIYVSTPTGLHYQHGIEVLRSGKHLWMEKSFTDSLTKTTELIKLANKKNKQVKECFMFRYHPHFETIQGLINENLGRIESIQSCFGFPHLENTNFRYDPDIGGGALLDAGAYPIHLLLTGGFEITPSNLRGSHANLSSGNCAVDINGIFSGSLKETNFNLEWGFGRSYRNDLTIWGERKTLKTKNIFSKPEDYQAKIILIDSEQNSTEITIDPVNHFRLMFQEFSKELKNNNYSMDDNLIMEQAQVIDHIFSRGL